MMQNHIRATLRNRVNKQGYGFVVSRGGGVPGSYRRMPLACLNNSIVGIP